MPTEVEQEFLDMPVDAGADEAAAAAGAESSTARGEPERDTLSLVRDVVEEAEAEPAASPAEAEKSGQEPGDPQPNPEDDDYANLPFNRHPRFQKLIGEVKSLRKEKAEHLKAVETLKPDAERYQNVQSFMDQNGLAAEEVAAHLTVLAQAKVDPVGAWERLRPAITDLMQRAGVIMPEDLQQGVAAGTYTEQAATELARLRAQQAARQQADKFYADRQGLTAEQQRLQALGAAATAWEQDRRTKDPNFAAKAERVLHAVAYLNHRDGRPMDADGVRKQLDAAYASVNASFAPPTPSVPPQRRAPVRPVTGGTNAGAPRAPKPENTLDIIRARAG